MSAPIAGVLVRPLRSTPRTTVPNIARCKGSTRLTDVSQRTIRSFLSPSIQNIIALENLREEGLARRAAELADAATFVSAREEAR